MKIAYRTMAMIGVAIFAASVATPALACSISPSPKIAIERIKARDDIRSIKGRFYVDRHEVVQGEYGFKGPLIGRLVQANGKSRDVFAVYDQFLIECVYSFTPTADAEGVFWISRKKTNGRFEILLAEGEYLHGPGSFETAESDRKDVH